MYEKDWDSKDTQRQQMGCALYFIDQLALRAGHEKDEDEADTVGCCTLKVLPSAALLSQLKEVSGFKQTMRQCACDSCPSPFLSWNAALV